MTLPTYLNLTIKEFKAEDFGLEELQFNAALEEWFDAVDTIVGSRVTALDPIADKDFETLEEKKEAAVIAGMKCQMYKRMVKDGQNAPTTTAIDGMGSGSFGNSSFALKSLVADRNAECELFAQLTAKPARAVADSSPSTSRAKVEYGY
jgi:hypothetical protein